MGDSPWVCKELDTTEQLSTAHHCIFPLCFAPLDNYAITIWSEGFLQQHPILGFQFQYYLYAVISSSPQSSGTYVTDGLPYDHIFFLPFSFHTQKILSEGDDPKFLFCFQMKNYIRGVLLFSHIYWVSCGSFWNSIFQNESVRQGRATVFHRIIQEPWHINFGHYDFQCCLHTYHAMGKWNRILHIGFL